MGVEKRAVMHAPTQPMLHVIRGYVSIRQNTLAYVSIRQQTEKSAVMHAPTQPMLHVIRGYEVWYSVKALLGHY
jgi:hypothetical protein